MSYVIVPLVELAEGDDIERQEQQEKPSSSSSSQKCYLALTNLGMGRENNKSGGGGESAPSP